MTVVGLFIILYIHFLDAREFSNHLPNTIPNWIKSFPRWKPAVISANLAGTLGMTSKMRARVRIPDDSPIEKKVDYLMQQVDRIQTIIDKLDDRIDEVNASVTKDINKLKSDLSHSSSALEKIVASHAIGDYDLNLFGIVITLCGTLIQFFST